MKEIYVIICRDEFSLKSVFICSFTALNKVKSTEPCQLIGCQWSFL